MWPSRESLFGCLVSDKTSSMGVVQRVEGKRDWQQKDPQLVEKWRIIQFYVHSEENSVSGHLLLLPLLW